MLCSVFLRAATGQIPQLTVTPTGDDSHNDYDDIGDFDDSDGSIDDYFVHHGDDDDWWL